jgi:hypothetical protein
MQDLPPPFQEEIALLRAQLAALADLIQAPAATPDTERLQQETALLRDLLAVLALSPPTQATAQARASSTEAAPALSALEVALTRLLSDLVQETDRRRAAEVEVLRAQALLRQHGLDGALPPTRIAVPARPTL